MRIQFVQNMGVGTDGGGINNHAILVLAGATTGTGRDSWRSEIDLTTLAMLAAASAHARAHHGSPLLGPHTVGTGGPDHIHTNASCCATKIFVSGPVGIVPPAHQQEIT